MKVEIVSNILHTDIQLSQKLLRFSNTVLPYFSLHAHNLHRSWIQNYLNELVYDSDKMEKKKKKEIRLYHNIQGCS